MEIVRDTEEMIVEIPMNETLERYQKEYKEKIEDLSGIEKELQVFDTKLIELKKEHERVVKELELTQTSKLKPVITKAKKIQIKIQNKLQKFDQTVIEKHRLEGVIKHFGGKVPEFPKPIPEDFLLEEDPIIVNPKPQILLS